MKKSLSPQVFVLFMGLILLIGLGFSLGLYFFLNPRFPKMTVVNLSPVTSQPVSMTVNLTSPADHSLVFASEQLIQGKTSPNVIAILSTNKNDQVINVDADGNFSQMVTLQEGAHEIIVSAFDNEGNGQVEKRTIYYSKEQI